MIPLVLVHGFMGGSAQWTAQVAAFEDHRDVIAVDLPGFGANNRLPPVDAISSFAQWVIADLRRRGVQQYHLLGHSMGGMIAQEIVRLDQDHIERLILYGTGAEGVLPGRFETIEQSKARANVDGASTTARRISATWFLDQDRAPAYPKCAELAERSSLEAIHAGLDAMQSWQGVEFLPKITRDTLVICGDSDRTYAWPQTQQLWNDIPRARLAVVPHCAHTVHLEKPDIFNLLVRDFLSE